MATQKHSISGKLKWTQNLTSYDDFRGQQNYKVNLYDIDEEAWNATGVQTRPKVDKEGNKLFLLKRPDSKVIKGETVEFGPPQVVDADGNDLTDVMIGNGSEATVDFITYDTGQYGKGHRVEKVTVTNLIEYIPQGPEAGTPAGEVDKSVFE